MQVRPKANKTSEAKEALAILARTTDSIVSDVALESLVSDGKPLIMKYGVDLTAPLLHIGHAVNLWMYRALQELGHQVVLLLGDFTTTIGDPTGRNKTRPVLSEEDIQANSHEILSQALTVLINEPHVLQVRRNSEWFDAMPTRELLSIISETTVDHLLSRDMFRKRREEGHSIATHELLYPILQGWDSVALESGLTIIGADQLFNEMMGRALQQRRGLRPQTIITSTITPGIGGPEKQSKSLGNYIAINHSPRDKFGRLMRVDDEYVALYMKTYTTEPLERIDELATMKPMDAKMVMAQSVVARWHGTDIAAHETEFFSATFRNKTIDADSLPMLTVPAGTSAAHIVRLIRTDITNAEMRRLFTDGAIHVDDKKINDWNEVITQKSFVMKVGKRTWVKILVEN